MLVVLSVVCFQNKKVMAKRNTNKSLLIIPPVPNRKALNAPLIEIIINALQGERLPNNTMIPYNYLLNQAIRQYIIPDKNWHLSIKAKDLWDSITSKRQIEEYHYQQLIECDYANQTPAKIYVGANTKGSYIKIKRGEMIPFNKLFTAEHMTPVADIKKELEALTNITPVDVEAVLDRIHICRVTKEEDKSIQPKWGRGTNYGNILSTAYKDIPLVY